MFRVERGFRDCVATGVAALRSDLFSTPPRGLRPRLTCAAAAMRLGCTPLSYPALTTLLRKCAVPTDSATFPALYPALRLRHRAGLDCFAPTALFSMLDAALKRRSTVRDGLRSTAEAPYGITAATLGGVPVLVSGVESGFGDGLGDVLGGTVALFFFAGDGGKLNSTPRSSLAFTVAGMSRSTSAIFFRA